MTGIRFSSTQRRTVSRTARSSSFRSESKPRKSTPVNWDVTMPVAIQLPLLRWRFGRKDRRVPEGAGAGLFGGDLPCLLHHVHRSGLRPDAASPFGGPHLRELGAEQNQ